MHDYPIDTLDKNEKQWYYNCLDTVYTREVGEESLAIAEALGLTGPNAFQHEIFPAIFYAMTRGVRIDKAERKRMDAQLEREILERQAFLDEIAGAPLNVRSPKQMQAFFYDDLKMPIQWKKRDDGGRSPSLDDAALDTLKRKEPLLKPIIHAIQELRSLGVFLSTFVRAPLDYDERMRCSYNICGTETFRLASAENVFGSGTNLANVPKGGEDDESELILPNIRTLFIPDEGKTWFDGDLSKADLRIVVKESNCTEMQAMLDEGRDPYIETAREYYRDPTIQKYNADGTENIKYDRFKRFSHGTHYLGTPHGLSQRIGLSVHECDRAQRWYFGKYPQIKTWQDDFVQTVKRTRKVTNRFGYQRVYLGRVDDSTCREAVAWLPQSTIALYINKIWAAIWKQCPPPKVEVLLQVHDSLDGQYPTDEPEWKEKIEEVARGVSIPYDPPLVIPFKLKTSTKSWGACQ